VIAHRLSTIEKADRIVVLEGGKIIETGNHQSLMSRDGVYASLFRLGSAGLPPAA
jgi:subfamily B ATP-binding cassette protein MsbA